MGEGRECDDSPLPRTARHPVVFLLVLIYSNKSKSLWQISAVKNDSTEIPAAKAAQQLKQHKVFSYFYEENFSICTCMMISLQAEF